MQQITVIICLLVNSKRCLSSLFWSFLIGVKIILKSDHFVLYKAVFTFVFKNHYNWKINNHVRSRCNVSKKWEAAEKNTIKCNLQIIIVFAYL